MEDLRDSGIDIIGHIPWGTHISHLYSSKADFAKVLAPYIRTGLENNEMCIWIHSNNIDRQEAISILEPADEYIRRNQLRILPYTQWYILDDSFNDLRLNKQWLDLINYAKQNGFAGLRAAGDTAWLEKSYKKDFSVYEQKINTSFSDLPFIALCLFDVNKVSISEVADILNDHSYSLISEDDHLKLIRSVELLVKERQLAENKKIVNEMKRYDKLKTEFFSNISHELRTPLNVILSTVQLMKQLKKQSGANMSDDRENKYLKIIRQNCYRQLRLVNNLIDISKIDSDYYDLHLQICDIIGIIKGITNSVTEYIENKGITLSFKSNTDNLLIACDPDQIERIILNLLSNAIKFTNSGGNISVDVLEQSEKVLICVKDTGAGIPRDKLDCIFNRFQQVDMSLTRKHEGSGIGLSLVKSLVEKHNGTISVSSEMGKGTEFIIELPFMAIQPELSESFMRDKPYVQNYVEKISIEFADIYS